LGAWPLDLAALLGAWPLDLAALLGARPLDLAALLGARPLDLAALLGARPLTDRRTVLHTHDPLVHRLGPQPALDQVGEHGCPARSRTRHTDHQAAKGES